MDGRRFAYLGVIVGLLVSIWANVEHARLQPGGAETGALAMGAFWPAALFLALEVLTRTSWAGGTALAIARVGIGVVAAGAATISYLHLHALLQHYGEQPLPALVGPLAIDGLMAVSAAALLVGEHVVDAPAAPVLEVVHPDPAPDLPEPAPAAKALGDPVDVVHPVPVAAAEQARPARITAPAIEDDEVPRGRASDAELLDQAHAALARGDLTRPVSGNQLRALLGVGAERARRIADQLAADPA